MNGFYFCRFQKNDLERLSSGLCLPDKYTCVQGTLATGPTSTADNVETIGVS